jgi:outer membrane lipoprotein-sorting protein
MPIRMIVHLITINQGKDQKKAEERATLSHAAGRQRRLGKTALRLGLLLLPCALTTALQAGGAGPDANALVRKMVATYKKATSIQETTEATVTVPGGSAYVQSTNMKWKHPNQTYLHSQDPQQGTVSVHTDGKTITIYSARQNIFTRRNAPTDLRETMETINRASTQAFNIQMTQVLNPISFLLTTDMPREAKAFRYAGMATLNGRRAHKVVGQADPNWVRGMVPAMTVVPIKRDVILWIDAQTNLLLKSAGNFTWKVTSANGAKLQTPQIGGILFEEVHRNTLLNIAMRDEDFRFFPPKGAKQLFQERQ